MLSHFFLTFSGFQGVFSAVIRPQNNGQIANPGRFSAGENRRGGVLAAVLSQFSFSL